jgi:hypothetical protein
MKTLRQPGNPPEDVILFKAWIFMDFSNTILQLKNHPIENKLFLFQARAVTGFTIRTARETCTKEDMSPNAQDVR